MTFNLISPVSTINLRLYIREVGNNGEVAGTRVTVEGITPGSVPEPATLGLLGFGLVGAYAARRRMHRD